MALEPITRQEQIIAGKDLQPITRMEKFLKNFGGGGGMFVARPEYGVPYTQFNELCAAYESGKTIIAVYDEYGNDLIYQLTNVNRDDYGNVISVIFIWMGMGNINELIIQKDGEVFLDQREFTATSGK